MSVLSDIDKGLEVQGYFDLTKEHADLSARLTYF